MPPASLAQAASLASLADPLRPKWLKTARTDFFRLASVPGFDDKMLQGWAVGWLQAIDEKDDRELFLQALRVWVSARAALREI